MRSTSTAIAAASAILVSVVNISGSAAQTYDVGGSAMPVPNAPVNDVPQYTPPNLPQPPSPQAPAPQAVAAGPQAYPQPRYQQPPRQQTIPAQPNYQQQAYQAESYQPAQGYASDKLPEGEGFSPQEIKDAGHRFFGNVSSGFARAVEYVFQRSGRPNGYIVGEEAGGAFVAGLRYGEGTLHTPDGSQYRVFWQGPSVGYDFGAEGSKTMVLVYNLRNPAQIYNTFGGVDGSAYLVGGVGVTYLARDDVVLAPIRSGVGLRLGANLGYLKYTRQPTWNPF